MLHLFESFLYQISVALLFPVVTALLLLTLWTVICLGRFAREYYERTRKKMNLTDRFKKRYRLQITEALNSGDQADIHLTKLLRQWERKQIDRLDLVRFIIKTGPTLGLAGTLIPMGTALQALSQGDMMAMSTSMVTAFTTTIVGITCGLVAYLISIVKEKWMKAGFLDCELYCELLLREQVNNKATDAETQKNNPGNNHQPIEAGNTRCEKKSVTL